MMDSARAPAPSQRAVAPTTSTPTVSPPTSRPDVGPLLAVGPGLLALQRTIGNRAVTGLLASRRPTPDRSAQRSITIGQDKPEDDPRKVLFAFLQQNPGYEARGLGVLKALGDWNKEDRTFAGWAQLKEAVDAALGNTRSFPVVGYGGRVFVLMGLSHTLGKTDHSGLVSRELLADSALVVEYPPMLLGQTAFTGGDTGQIADDTQTGLVKKALGVPVTVIGADGRKAYAHDKKTHLGLSIRHKGETEFAVNPGAPDKPIDRHAMSALARTYVNASLGLSTEAFSAEVFAQGFESFVRYTNQDIAATVLPSTFNAVRDVSGSLDEGNREAIAKTVLAELTSALDTELGDYTSEVEGAKKNYSEPEDAVHLEIYVSQLLQAANQGLVNHFNDAICNLLFLVSALATKPPSGTVVVAFGGEHVKLLNQLLQTLRSETQAVSTGQKEKAREREKEFSGGM